MTLCFASMRFRKWMLKTRVRRLISSQTVMEEIGRPNPLRPRRSLQWRLLFLSSGERTLSDHAGTAGKETQAGSEVRMLNIPADAGQDSGCLRNSTKQLRRRSLQQSSKVTLCATTVILLANMEDAVELARRHRDDFIREYAAGATGEVIRAASRLGITAASQAARLEYIEPVR
jgi:hypothetical protein